jgi:hypothetical protein
VNCEVHGSYGDVSHITDSGAGGVHCQVSQAERCGVLLALLQEVFDWQHKVVLLPVLVQEVVASGKYKARLLSVLVQEVVASGKNKARL